MSAKTKKRKIVDEEVNLEDLGRRARERREEEIGKRKEIVVLDSQPDNDFAELSTGQKKKKSLVIRAKKKKTKPSIKSSSSSKRPRSSISTSHPTTKKGEHDKNRDDYITEGLPDVSHLMLPEDSPRLDSSPANARSNTVRIHGLPIEARPADLLVRFFASLDPICVFVLPTNAVRIVEWDGLDNHRKRKQNHTPLERHPTSFRVYVQFANVSAATLAAKRSGEVIYVKESNTCTATEASANTKKKGAAIAVTQLTKRTAKYLQRNMAVECKRSNALPISEMLRQSEKDLHELVPQILWTAVLQDLKLCATASDGKRQVQLYKPLVQSSDIHSINPTTQKGYNQLVEVHNQLIQDYETLEFQFPFFPGTVLETNTSTHYPNVSITNSTQLLRKMHPSIFLKESAMKRLLRAAKHIEDYLQMGRSIAKNTESVFDLIAIRDS
mgnify:CR=1 FL=1